MENKDIVKIENNSPADMIKAAVSGGADLDKLEKLLTLQERWEANEARKAYHQAMADFKTNPPKIGKDKKVGYKTEKGSVGYSHASLFNVTEKISAELSKHGLSASWTTKQNGNILVTCKITHVKGHSEETTLAASADTSGSKNSIQAIGSTITYLERYTLLALTGLATYDMDDDAQKAVPAKFITDKQLSILCDILDNLPIPEKNKPNFLKFMKLEKLEDMLQADFPKAMAAVEATKKAAKK